MSSVKDKHPSICYNCEYARKVTDSLQDEGYVGCVLRLFPRGRDTKYDYDEIQEGEEIAEGWIYSKLRPFQEKNSNVWGHGVMTNFQLITKEIKSCNQFTEVRDGV